MSEAIVEYLIASERCRAEIVRDISRAIEKYRQERGITADYMNMDSANQDELRKIMKLIEYEAREEFDRHYPAPEGFLPRARSKPGSATHD